MKFIRPGLNHVEYKTQNLSNYPHVRVRTRIAHKSHFGAISYKFRKLVMHIRFPDSTLDCE